MPARTAAEKLARKQALEAKREARRLAKEQRKAKEKGTRRRGETETKNSSSRESSSEEPRADCHIFGLSDDTLAHLVCFLPSREVGALALACRRVSLLLVDARARFVLSRLSRDPASGRRGTIGSFRSVSLCADQSEARSIVERSYGGGDTKRIRAKGSAGENFASEFVSYARFLEEAVSGYATQNFGGKEPAMLPAFVNGRFVSVSPEHSLARVGGGASSGAGGSGCASWGVGKRGQLGHGKREDEPNPRMLVGGIGYGIRIVQVSAGGGLVRVAHSLLLTASGRVMSFGTGQYGALGHGFSSGKQLPDGLRPRYVEALARVRCTGVSAGELHSAVTTVDGDVYTWGDGFCGQLGHGDKSPQPAPVQVARGGLDDEVVCQISCGARHTVAVTEDGEAFTWGLGHFGVLGRSYTPFDHEPEGVLTGLGVEEDEQARDNNNQAAAAAPAAETNAAAPSNDWNFESLMEHLDMIKNLSLTDSSDQCIPMRVDSLEGIKIVGSCAGHRHTLLLDDHGGMYSCGSGNTGCLGLGDNSSQMYPMRIKHFDEKNIKIMQMSAGVDMSMAVSTDGAVYAWGKTDQGRIGLGLKNDRITLPRQVRMQCGDQVVKAIDVECGYVHSMIVALCGTIYQCGSVGLHGQSDGSTATGEPTQVNDFNIWHRVPEPREKVQQGARWKKYGKYEVKGREKMMSETD